MKHLILAMQTMTRLPIHKQLDVTGEDYAKSVAWFPVTALSVGLVSALVYALTLLLGIPYLAALLSVIAAALFTGGFHMDGFADVCDAFFARKDKERTLEILKDSRMGTYGVLGLVFLVTIKTILIGTMGLQGILIVVAAPICGKMPMAICAKLSSYPREQGLAKYIIEQLSTGRMWACLIGCAALLVLLVGPISAGIMAAAMLVVALLMTQCAKKRIGGATGDVLGTCNELGEIVFLIWMAVMV